MLAVLLFLSLAFGADTLCGVTQSTPASASHGTRTADGAASTIYKLGTLVGTRVVGYCSGKVYSVTWNRAYYGLGIKPAGPGKAPLGRAVDIASDFSTLVSMHESGGWRVTPIENPDTDVVEYVAMKDGDGRLIALRAHDLPEGDRFFILTVGTFTPDPCLEGM